MSRAGCPKRLSESLSNFCRGYQLKSDRRSTLPELGFACESEKLMPCQLAHLRSLFLLAGQKAGIYMARSSVCWSHTRHLYTESCKAAVRLGVLSSQLGVFLAGAREMAVEGNAAESPCFLCQARPKAAPCMLRACPKKCAAGVSVTLLTVCCSSQCSRSEGPSSKPHTGCARASQDSRNGSAPLVQETETSPSKSMLPGLSSDTIIDEMLDISLRSLIHESCNAYGL